MKLRHCLEEIAKRETNPPQISRLRYLSDWTASSVSSEWFELKNKVSDLFKERHKKLQEDKKIADAKKEDEENKKIEKIGKAFLETNKDLFNKFLEITERKVSVIDDYGDENWDALPKEIETLLVKFAKKENIYNKNFEEWLKGKTSYWWNISKEGYAEERYEWLRGNLGKLFREYHNNQEKKPTQDLNNLSGIEFETYIGQILKENGYDVAGTPATGDQGADLVAKKNGKTIIIQAKRHQNPVGNKAVQEVIGAISFYRGNEGWVITNSTFTPSAKALAQKGNVKLIDGNMLSNIKDFLTIESAVK